MIGEGEALDGVEVGRADVLERGLDEPVADAAEGEADAGAREERRVPELLASLAKVDQAAR